MRARVAESKVPGGGQVLVDAVSAAVMAPSSHNTQPWRFRIVGDTTLEIHADGQRHLSVIDPERRQLVQSCGCALFNARVAVRASGYRDEVTVMVTDRTEPSLLATLHLGGLHVPTPGDRALMEAIPLRRTNRRPFVPRPVAPEESDVLARVAGDEGAWMRRLDPDAKRLLGRLIDQADRQQFGDPGFREELARWLRHRGSRKRDGIPLAEKEYGDSLPFGLVRALRSPGLGEAFGEAEQDLVAGAPLVAVLGTETDEPTEWLASGQALQAVLLHATSVGLAASFLNQVLEIPGLRGEVAALVGGGAPHMVLRLGYPSEPVAYPAPRRTLSDVLQIER